MNGGVGVLPSVKQYLHLVIQVPNRFNINFLKQIRKKLIYRLASRRYKQFNILYPSPTYPHWKSTNIKYHTFLDCMETLVNSNSRLSHESTSGQGWEVKRLPYLKQLRRFDKTFRQTFELYGTQEKSKPCMTLRHV